MKHRAMKAAEWIRQNLTHYSIQPVGKESWEVKYLRRESPCILFFDDELIGFAKEYGWIGDIK